MKNDDASYKSIVKISAMIVTVFLIIVIVGLCNIEFLKNRSKILILWTSDIHCEIDTDSEVAYIKELKNSYLKQGYNVILLDDGDFIHDAEKSKEDATLGRKYIDIMNKIGYQYAIPGNHEFGFGADQFEKLRSVAKFPYICCNVFYNDKMMFKPYAIKTIHGKKIAFIGYTSPWNTDKYRDLFADDDGVVRYKFISGDDGQAAFDLLQMEIDEVRNLGADYVYLFAHAGLYEDTEQNSTKPLIENTYGIDICVDAHTHDIEKKIYQNKLKQDVLRIAVGDRLHYVGYSLINLNENTIETDMWAVNLEGE